MHFDFYQCYIYFFQDYEEFDLANEIDELEKFLKVTPAVSTAEIIFGSKAAPKEIQQNGNTSSREVRFLLFINLFLVIIIAYEASIIHKQISSRLYSLLQPSTEKTPPTTEPERYK